MSDTTDKSEPRTIPVIAIAQGFYGNARRRRGQQFLMEVPANGKLPKWVMSCEDGVPPLPIPKTLPWLGHRGKGVEATPNIQVDGPVPGVGNPVAPSQIARRPLTPRERKVRGLPEGGE